MPVVYEEALKSDISSGKIARCYLLFGNDSYLKKHYSDELGAKSYDGDPFFNFQHFEDNFNVQELFDAVTEYPMMADKKCVTVCDFDYEHASKSDFDSFLKVISQIGDGCTLIVRFENVEFDIKKNSKAKKILSACENAGGKAVCLDHRSLQSLARMVMTAVSKRGCRINEVNARYLIENVGDDIYAIRNETEKLCNYVTDKEIDKQTIDYLCIKTVEASVYDFVKKIFACDITGALNMLGDLFFMRIEPVIILHTVATSYIDVYRAYSGKKAGKNSSQIAADFGYKNRAFVIDRALLNAKKFDSSKLNLSFDALLKADDSLKSFSSDQRTVLEQLTVRLIYIISKGEAVDKD